MTPRDVVRCVLAGKRPPYVPWSFGFTLEAREKLEGHFGTRDWETGLGNHLLWLSNPCHEVEEIGGGRVRDAFGVTWDRSVDKDIGTVEGFVLREPGLKGYRFPDLDEDRLQACVEREIQQCPDRFRVYGVSFSLYERAWTLRGMENLMVDFHENPDFVHELLNAIADFNIRLIKIAARQDIDAFYFGDDWGQQKGLQMGAATWRMFLAPVLRRMYGAAREAGKLVMIHSCGDVDELFDDLICLGVSCFNPFQPEVMDVASLVPRYRGRLAFHGGLSTQRTLPYGTTEDVRRETRRLIGLGREGGYIFAPAHAVEGDVSLENMLAFIEEAQRQPGAPQDVAVTNQKEPR